MCYSVYGACFVGMIRKIELEERRHLAQIIVRLAKIFDVSRYEQTTFLRFAREDWKFVPVETQ